jgi:type IV secretory pathway VirD2 relaxase
MFGAGAGDFDRGQRAVVKIHYFNHAGVGAASLKVHGKYIAREAASLDAPSEPDLGRAEPGQEAEQARAHAIYLERQGKSAFYDFREDSVDGTARLEDWAQSDIRHFRLILSAEEGARLRDLPSYAREVMARAGAALGTELRWIAVDHHDTDNPHSHIVVRGRRANGQDLVNPKDFIKHGFRTIARDVATERLGQRSREDERLALDRETRRHAPTRLDKLLEGRADASGRLRIAEIAAPNGDAHLSQAMKQRLRELERMGLAQDKGRGLFQLEPAWRDRLQAMEQHANVRKRVVRERVEQNRDHQRDLLRRITRGGLER